MLPAGKLSWEVATYDPLVTTVCTISMYTVSLQSPYLGGGGPCMKQFHTRDRQMASNVSKIVASNWDLRATSIQYMFAVC